MSDSSVEPGEAAQASRGPYESVPAELKARAQWVSFRLLPPMKGGKKKPIKFPVDAQTGAPADTTERATWATFDQAVQYAQAHGLAGVGFVFTSEDPYAGVDLDDCRDKTTGKIADWARAIIDALGSYTEVSFSS